MDRKILKVTVAALASAYFFSCIANPGQWHFIDGVNLLVHEGGHVIFSPFGMFLYILGGSLTQVLVPLLFVFYFFHFGQKYSASLTLFWVGESLLNVYLYAADAQKMQLQLLFGDNSIHDWNWLLIYTGQLHHTKGIATSIEILGIIAIIMAACGAFYFAWTQKNQLQRDL